MLGHRHFQPQATQLSLTPFLFESMGSDEFAQALKDPTFRAAVINCITAAHADNVVSKNAKPQLFKTEMCRFWEEHGDCRRNNCWFAHGKEELRSVERHPKYKTKVCESFSKTGKCGYGKRCVYIHPRYGDANYQGKSNVLLDASQTLLNANVNLSALQNLSPSVLNEALLACKSRFAGLLGLEFGQDVQKSDQALQHSSSDLQATTQQQKQSVMIPKTPSGGSHELMNCQLSSSPDSPLSGSSTTPTSMISHSPASSTASNKGCQFPLPQWRIHGKSLTQPRFDFLKQPTLPEGFAAGHLPHQKNSFNGEEKENDVFLSSKENEQDFSQAWYLTVNGTKPLAKKDSSMTKSPSDEYLFMIEA